MLGNLCLNACCDKTIGFDEAAWSWITRTGCLSSPEFKHITGIASNITILTPDIHMLLAGNNFTCGKAMRFSMSDWYALKAWIQAGGILFICAEHSGNAPAGVLSFRCLQDMDQLNDFFSFMETSLLYVGNDCNGGFPSDGLYIPGAARIADGVLDFGGSRFGELSGGTTVFTGYAGGPDIPGSLSKNGLGLVAVVAERVGNGFIFCTGDSNHDSVSTSCNFIRKIFEHGDPDTML